MACAHTTSGMQALYRVFILPTLNKAARPQLLSRPSFQLLAPSTHRPFSQTIRVAVKYREPEGHQRCNEEISAAIIRLVDPETNILDQQTVTRYDILNSLDQSTHRLVQFTDDAIPVCKIINKKDDYDARKKKKQEAKEKKKETRTSSTLKTLELNWAIDEHDLGHRLGKVKAFLEEGRKVEIVLAAKKKGRGRQATKEECAQVLEKIRNTVDSVKGAREIKALDGVVGGIATMTIQGVRPMESSSNAAPVPDTPPKPTEASGE